MEKENIKRKMQNGTDVCRVRDLIFSARVRHER
jgi:hypothetical protein